MYFIIAATALIAAFTSTVATPIADCKQNGLNPRECDSGSDPTIQSTWGWNQILQGNRSKTTDFWSNGTDARVHQYKWSAEPASEDDMTKRLAALDSLHRNPGWNAEKYGPGAGNMTLRISRKGLNGLANGLYGDLDLCLKVVYDAAVSCVKTGMSEFIVEHFPGGSLDTLKTCWIWGLEGGGA